MKKITTGLIISAITALHVQAVDVPNIGNALKEVKPPKIEKKKRVLPPLEQESKEYKKMFQDGKKIEVKKINIIDAKYISQTELEALVKPYENKMLSFKEIQEVVDLITQAYRQKGYFVARAYLPVQDIKKQNGVLTIAILEGEYGEFNLENNSLVKNDILQNTLDEVKKDKIISSASLQRALLLINDTPGVFVESTKIKPGALVGTSDFIIGTNTTERYNGYAIADNYGSQYTGKHRIMAGFDINSPFNIGDKISLSALSSEEMGLLNGRIAYNFPIYKNGLRGEVSYSKTSYELGSTYDELDAVGYADSIVAKVYYPYIRTNNENLTAYLQTSYNKMTDEIQSTSTRIKKNTVVAQLGLDYSKNSLIKDLYNQTKINTYFTLGRLSFQDSLDQENDEVGANTSGRFTKINIDIENTTVLNEKMNWKNALQLQYALADKNLDGSQDMSLGGIYGVKFYQDGEESAENGYIYNTELTYTLPSYQKLNSRVSIFYDIGRVYMSEDTTNEKSRTLQDVGVGYYGSYDDFFLNAHLAYKIGGAKVTSQEDYSSRFMFQAGYIF